MKWLITGGCGFIGRNLVQMLCQEGGHGILIIDNLSGGDRNDIGRVCRFSVKKPDGDLLPSAGDVYLVVGDILDEHLALNISAGFDVIVHLAANSGVESSVRNPRFDCETNVLGTLNYLEAARRNRVKRFVFASSGAPIGECSPPIHEELPAHPVSPYGASKLAGEGYCSAYYRTFGVETVSLRFGNVYGPHSDHKSSVVARFIQRAITGKTLEIYGDGTQTRDFIHVGDLIEAIRMAAIRPGIGGETFQIASNSETSVLKLSKILTALLARKGIRKVNVRHSPERTGDVKRNYSDVSKARSLLGWNCSRTLDAGLEDVVDWYFWRNHSQEIEK